MLPSSACAGLSWFLSLGTKAILHVIESWHGSQAVGEGGGLEDERNDIIAKDVQCCAKSHQGFQDTATSWGGASGL